MAAALVSTEALNVNELLAALGAVVLACVPLVRTYIQHKVTPDQLARVSDIAGGAVRAAEQVGEKFKGEDPADWTKFATWGEAKEAFAAGVIAKGAKRLGIKLTDDEVSTFLHAALRKMEQMAEQSA